jgi:hypothetical protein
MYQCVDDREAAKGMADKNAIREYRSRFVPMTTSLSDVWPQEVKRIKRSGKKRMRFI